MTTVKELVFGAASQFAAAGIDDATLEAALLLANVLGVDRSRLLAMGGCCPAPRDIAAFRSLRDRRLAREPLAYILGHREFYGVELACAPGVLIPRPETEILVDIAVEAASRHDRPRIADVGTGSGAIAVAVALHASNAVVTAIDTSEVAIALAKQNLEAHAVQDRVVVRRGDLLTDGGVFDVIVANLPYVREAEWNALQPEVREHEPRSALIGGIDGTEVIRRLFRQATDSLAPAGVLAVEVGAGQSDAMRSAACHSFPEAHVSITNDLAGIERVIVVRQ